MSAPSFATSPVRARKQPTTLVVIGHPVSQSLSPPMHTAALRAAGLSVPYERRDVAPDALTRTLADFARDGVGGNVTMPHKEAVFAATVHATALATRVGSVNTFWHEHGILHGHNTDVGGVFATIRSLMTEPLHTTRVAVLGAGGTAAAVLVALELAGCTDIRLASRTPDRARRLSTRVQVHVQVALTATDVVQGAALVINTTPVGMQDEALPVDPALLADDCAVFDLVYRKGQTAWIRGCRERGLRAEDGLRMLVEQGAESFRVWFDVEPSLDAMWGAVR